MVGGAEFLPGVDEGRALCEEDPGGPAAQRLLIRQEGGGARPVVVLQAPELAVVVREESLLLRDPGQVLVQAAAARHGAGLVLIQVIIVADVEGLVELAVAQDGDPVFPAFGDKRMLHRLRQPDAAGAHFFHLSAGPLPEVQRDERRHVTAEAVHIPGPHLQGPDLIVPETGIGIVQVDHVPPVADPVAKAPVSLVIEPLRVLLSQYGIRRRVIIDHVQHHLEAGLVRRLGQVYEILHRPQAGIHSPIVFDRIRGAETSLSVHFAGGLDRQQVENVGAQRLDAGQILLDRAKSAGPMIACEDLIDQLAAKFSCGVSGHALCLLLYLSLFFMDPFFLPGLFLIPL